MCKNGFWHTCTKLKQALTYILPSNIGHITVHFSSRQGLKKKKSIYIYRKITAQHNTTSSVNTALIC